MSIKINNNSKRNKRMIVVTVIALLIVLLLVLFYYLTYMKPAADERRIDEENRQKEKVVNDKVKEDLINSPTDTSKQPASPQVKPGQPDGGDYTPPSDSSNISLEAQRTDTRTVSILTKLYGYSDGTCNLSVINGASSYTKSAAILFQREHSLCEGFNVPIEELGVGNWTIKLEVLSGGVKTTKQINYEVK